MDMPVGETNPFRILGAFAPSSRRLADAMTRFVVEERDRILEVGAGSGAITKSIVEKMSPHQTSDVVEFFSRLAALLEIRFRKHSSVAIHGGDILDFNADANTYDVIICSLPFNAFAPETTKVILEKLVYLAKDGAIMSFFEYRVLQGLAKAILPPKKRSKFLGSQELIELFCSRFKFDETSVTLNIPPAVVHYLRIDKSGDVANIFRRN